MECRPSRELLLPLRSSQPRDLVAAEVPYLGEESFCIKKISVSCLRARRKKICHYCRLFRDEKKKRRALLESVTIFFSFFLMVALCQDRANVN